MVSLSFLEPLISLEFRLCHAFTLTKGGLTSITLGSGLFRLICETPELLSGAHSRFWSPLLQALVGLFELPEDDSIPDDEHFIDIEDTPGYQVHHLSDLNEAK